MDFLQLEPVKSAVEIQLLHPVHKTLLFDEATKEPVTVSVFGADSEEYIAKRRKLVDMRQAAAAKRRSRLVPQEQIDDDAVALLASIITSWNHIELDGAPLVCNPANVTMMLKRFKWFYDQIDEASSDRANFIKGSPTN